MRRNLCNQRRGQSIVESTLILLVFLVCLIGILDFGQVMFINQGWVERCRAGARWGAVNPYDPAKIQNVVRFNQSTDPPNGTAPFVGLSAANVVVSHPNAGTEEERIVVAINNYRFYFFSPWIAGAVTMNKISRPACRWSSSRNDYRDRGLTLSISDYSPKCLSTTSGVKSVLCSILPKMTVPYSTRQ
jgi:hypothetical protein